MSRYNFSVGVVALAAATVVLPLEAQANHENRYFGFGFQPFPYTYAPPPVIYEPPPGVREVAPGVFEYEVAPGQWVRVRPDHRYRSRWNRPRHSPRPQEALHPPGPPPVPQSKPDEADNPDEPPIVVRAPAPAAPAEAAAEPAPQVAAQPAPAEEPAEAEPERMTAKAAPVSRAGGPISCEDAVNIVESFGFSDVKSTSCSGEIYGFDASRDGTAYSIKLSAADGELTEVRRR